MSKFELREPTPDPPRQWRRPRRCHFCPGIRMLTDEEEHASDLVGSLPRCTEHLDTVGLAVDPK